MTQDHKKEAKKKNANPVPSNEKIINSTSELDDNEKIESDSLETDESEKKDDESVKSNSAALNYKHAGSTSQAHLYSG